ncbi:MAG: carbohydrate ABC transporter permease [Fimbriimonadaceae bacterium]|nr:carbohydrate ABC transporter permease [Fimbriimonadaceae bacterium]
MVTVILAATIAFWVGGFLLLRAAYLGLRLAWSPAGPARAGSSRKAWTTLALGGASLVLGGTLAPSPGLNVPIVWPVLPFPSWIGLWVGLAGLTHFVRGFLSDRRSFKPGAVCLGVAALLFWWGSAEGGPPRLLTGQIPLSPGGAIGLGALGLASVSAMAYASRSVQARGVSRTVATQLALAVGAALFAIPFLWQLVTSFKEDRDMASPEGIIWVPRVQATVPYRNPDKPYYEARYQGMRVEANLMRAREDGVLELSIVRPAGLGSYTFEARPEDVKEIPREANVVSLTLDGRKVTAMVVDETPDGRRKVEVTEPRDLAGRQVVVTRSEAEPVRPVSLRWRNFTDALEFLPPETLFGLLYLRNTLFLVVMNVIGTVLSCSLVAYAFARLRFPGREILFNVMLSTMMLPAAVTILPQFLLFKNLGWVNTLNPLWVTSFFAGAFNVFMLRQFFKQVPYELEDAAKIDGCSYLKTFWSILMPQVKPALAVIAIWTFMGAWNNFMGPLIYVNTPELMPISYAVQMFNGERYGEPGLLMAFVTMSMVPVIALFASPNATLSRASP